MNIVGRKCAWSVVATTTACLALTLSLSGAGGDNNYDDDRER